MSRLCAYSWPGNIRELQNIIERAVVLSKGPVLTVEGTALFDLPRSDGPANNAVGTSIGSPPGTPATSRLAVARRSRAPTHRRCAQGNELADRRRARRGETSQPPAEYVAESDAETGHRAAAGLVPVWFNYRSNNHPR